MHSSGQKQEEKACPCQKEGVSIINGIRYKINSAKIESANAMIKRIQSNASGIFDVEYLFLKLRQIYYLRLQKQTKMPMSYYQQI